MRNRREDGASAVEFALIFPLIAMLLFGMITAGLALNSQQQINHAAREGSRFGATLEEMPGAGDAGLDTVAGRVRTTAVGQLNVPDSFICVLFIGEAGTTGPYWYDATSNPPTRITNSNDEPDLPCADALSGDDGQRVQVGVFSPARIEAIFVRRNVTLSATAVSQYEPRPQPQDDDDE